MKSYRFFGFVAAMLFLSEASGSVGEIPAQLSVAVISAFDPAMRGYHPGITVFGNEGWSAENTGFDINSTVLDAARLNSSRELKFVNGEGLHLFPEKEGKAFPVKKITSELAEKLNKLGQEIQVEVIFLIFDGVANDSIGQTNQPLAGFGFYKRAGREVVFWVPQVAIYDCTTRRFIGSDRKLEAQRLPDVDWQKSWDSFGSSQQHAIRRELEALVKGCMPAILSKAGLNDRPIKSTNRSFASIMLVPGADARPSLTESNQLEIPPGISIISARRAAVNGLKQEEWSVTTETDNELIGIRRDGKDESLCTVAVKDRMITLAYEGYQIQADGKRVPKEFIRWQNNLREAILNNLMGRAGGLPPPSGNELEVPPGMSVAAAYRAVVAGFKEREWSITSEAEGKIVGVYRKGKKEAVCTVTLNERVVRLVPEGYEIQTDGKRVPVEYRRWQNNLKESVFGELMKVAPESEP